MGSGFEKFTFHYGPIQIKCFFLRIIPSNIYIPLWSYSNLARANLYNTFLLIYIPLWSYSNERKNMGYRHIRYLHSTMVLFKYVIRFPSALIKRFTFHYGPIQIVHSANASFKRMSFTFHYGPIQIIVDIQPAPF